MGTETYLAGSEMDRLVAEKVLHWSSIDESSPEGKRGYKWLKSDGSKGCYTPYLALRKSNGDWKLFWLGNRASEID